MAALKTVKEQAPSTKGAGSKPKSGVSYPYYDLDQSVEVANVIHEKAGGNCTREQLAPLLGYSGTKNGGFLSRLSAAKTFGLVQEDGGNLRITERAQNILSPVTPEDTKRARIEAFLAVELFRNVYEKFKGTTLPADVGLKNLFQTTYKIVPDRIAPALRVLMDSAATAGFLSANRDRMTMPIVKGVGSEQKPPPETPPPADEANKGKGGSGGGEPPPGIPSAIYELMREFPPAGTTMSAKKRTNLVSALTALMTVLYPEEEISE